MCASWFGEITPEVRACLNLSAHDNSEALGRKDSEELSAATKVKKPGDRITADKEEPEEEDVTLADEDTAK